MTETKIPHWVNDNISPFEREQASTKGGVLSVLWGISEPTLKVLRMLGIVPDPRHPDIILEELEAKRKAGEILLHAANDNVWEEREQEAA